MLGSKLLRKGPSCLWTVEKPGNSFPLPGPCAIRAAYSSPRCKWSEESRLEGRMVGRPRTGSGEPGVGGGGVAVILMISDTLGSRGRSWQLPFTESS